MAAEISEKFRKLPRLEVSEPRSPVRREEEV
jgi:hypothetical protein